MVKILVDIKLDVTDLARRIAELKNIIQKAHNSDIIQLLEAAIHDCEAYLTGDSDDPMAVIYDYLGKALDILEGKDNDIQG